MSNYEYNKKYAKAHLSKIERIKKALLTLER